MEFLIKSNILNRNRKLIINSELIEFDDFNWINNSISKFSRGEVASLRYGVKFIRGYSFIIGRTYCIDIKSLDDRIIKIRLISLYGIRKTALFKKFNQILNAFFDTHHKDIVGYYLEIFESGIQVNILETAFRQSGVVINENEVSWEDLGTKTYATYYALFSKKDPTIYKSFSYLNDWNSAVVYSFSKQVLSEKGLLNIKTDK
ncbi:MAG: hypothetical protein JWN56_578 [Sphingobacteriales bacterium]|nr:hypothetical protein [Sphingobacteriales bacterium]